MLPQKFMDCNIFFSHAAKLEHFYFESKKLLVNYMDELYTKEKFKATRMTSDERVQQTARNRHCHQAIHPSLMGLWNQENLPKDPDVTVLARWGWKFQIWGIGIWHTRRSLQKTCLPLLRSRGGFLCDLWKKVLMWLFKICVHRTNNVTYSINGFVGALAKKSNGIYKPPTKLQ